MTSNSATNPKSTAPRHSVLPRGTCLAGLNERELERFFPDDTLGELNALAGNFVLFPTGTTTQQEWLDAIQRHKPEVLLLGWSTPALPDDFDLAESGVRYLCYLAGSVRAKVPERLIREGLIVTNWASSISRTIAECALMFILMALRRTSYWRDYMHNERGWHPPAGSQPEQKSLFHRKVGIHGFGNVARELVVLLQPFHVQLSAYCPPVPQALLDDYGVERETSLANLFRSNDVVVELEALTPATRHIVTEAMLRSMQPDAVFVNVGRGAVVDEEALERVAMEGRIRVALDVYEREPPPPDSPFRDLKEVILMPHQAGPTPDRMRDAGRHALNNIKAYFEGQPLNGQIVPEMLEWIS